MGLEEGSTLEQDADDASRSKLSETPESNDERMSVGSADARGFRRRRTDATPDDMEHMSIKMEAVTPDESEMDVSFHEGYATRRDHRGSGPGNESARVARQACHQMMRSMPSEHTYYQ